MAQMHQVPPPPIPPHWQQQRIPSRRKRLRNWIILLFLIMLAASIFRSWSDRVERSIPFITREAPPIIDLHPYVMLKRDELVSEAAKLGISILITDGHRSHEEQDALYEQGRSTKGPIVTHVKGGGSYHNYGLAIDFALLTPKGKAIWDLEYDGNRNGTSDWMEVVAIAKEIGFSWGGDWEGFKDYPHLQMDFGFTISELRRGFRPPEDPALEAE